MTHFLPLPHPFSSSSLWTQGESRAAEDGEFRVGAMRTVVWLTSFDGPPPRRTNPALRVRGGEWYVVTSTALSPYPR